MRIRASNLSIFWVWCVYVCVYVCVCVCVCGGGGGGGGGVETLYDNTWTADVGVVI